jgi:hypothetical protein
MGRTEFLSTLSPVEKCPAKANRVAARFMRTKGYGDHTPIGVFVDGELLYYYYRLPEGVLEVELAPVEGRWQRRVSDFITGQRDLDEMLGECQLPAETRTSHTEPVEAPKAAAPVPPVMFQMPSV